MLNKKATVQFSAKDALSMRDYEAKEELKDSYFKSILPDAAVSAAGLGAATAMVGRKNIKYTAPVALTYLASKMISKALKRKENKDYLDRPKAGRLLEVKKENEEHIITPEHMYAGIVLNSVLD